MGRILRFSVGIALTLVMVITTSCDLFGFGDDDTDTTDTTAPANVSGLTATPGDGRVVTLAWQPPYDSDFAGVNITWDNGGTTVQQVAAGTVTYTTPALSAGTTYAFTVKSRDGSGNVSAGVTATATLPADPVDPVDTTAPGEVQGLTARAVAGGKVTLSWQAPSDTDFAGVDVTWDNGGTAVQQVAAGTVTYTTAALTGGRTYTFTVKSRDATGNVSTGSTATAVPDATPPAEVTLIVGYSAGTNWVSFSWTNPDTPDYAGCRVSWTVNGNTETDDYAGTANAVGDFSKQGNAAVGSLAPLTPYQFLVQSYDAVGNLSAGQQKICVTDKAWTVLLEDDFSGATSGTWNTTGYKSFGGTNPMYGLNGDDATVTVGSYHISGTLDYPDAFDAGGATNTLIVIPANGILTIGKVAPDTLSNNVLPPDGAFDLSAGYKVEVGVWSDGASTASETVEVYLDNNTSTASNSVHGAQSLVTYLVGDALAYRTHCYQMVYDLPVRHDDDFDSGGPEFFLHPNAATQDDVPLGTTASYISIRNNSTVTIAIDYVKISN